MTFSIAIAKDNFIGVIFLPYHIKKIDQKDYYKRVQQISKNDIKKQGLLQLDWVLELINITENFKTKNLNLKFNKKHKKIGFKKFVEKASKQEIKYIHNTLDNYRVQILKLIKNNRPLIFVKQQRDQFIYKKDIINYADKIAKIKFDFKKVDQSLYYKLLLFINKQKIDIKKSNITILSNKNPCILFKNDLIWFDKKTGFNGNKLKPFLLKDQIVIPARMQEIYFEKFVKIAINNFEYHIEGFEINKIDTTIKTVINFEKTFTNQFIISLNFQYNNKPIPYYWAQKEFVKVIKLNEQYALESFERDSNFEISKINFLTNLGLINKQKYFGFPIDFKLKSEFINYLKPFIKKFKKENFIIKNRLFKQEINFEKPKIKYKSTIKQDWFDLKIVIQFKNFEIPFYEFKNHILNYISEFELPDQTIFIIPNQWFSQLNAHAKRTNTTNLTNIHLSNYFLLNKNKIIKPNKNITTIINQFKQDKNVVLPKNSIATLRNYQHIGYKWLYQTTRNKFGACLADDMGLGKTLQVITLLQKHFENKRVNTNEIANKQLSLFSNFNNQVQKTFKSTLLVLPKVLILNWQEELQKFASDLTYVIYYGNKRKEILNQNLHKKQLILTTYGVVRQDVEQLKNIEFSYLILDESQAIKNPNSKIYKAIIKLRSIFKISITGTPIENNLSDIWAQMNFLNPNILGNLNYFKNEYLEPIKNNANAPEINDLKTIINPFILRRLKQDVAKDLPDKIEQIIHCQMDKEQQEQYDREKSAVRNQLLFAQEKNTINILNVLNKLRQFVLHPKLVDLHSELNSGKFEQVKSVIDNLIAQGNKFLIFSSFVKHLEIYKSYFEQNNIDFSMLTGQSKNPQAIVKKYQESKNINPFLISIKAGGVGLNITSANYVLIIDPWWNPFVEQQAIDRTHRIGQTKNVFIYKFITKNSIEEKILALQKRKLALASSLINNNQINLNAQELIGLLQT